MLRCHRKSTQFRVQLLFYPTVDSNLPLAKSAAIRYRKNCVTLRATAHELSQLVLLFRFAHRPRLRPSQNFLVPSAIVIQDKVCRWRQQRRQRQRRLLLHMPGAQTQVGAKEEAAQTQVKVRQLSQQDSLARSESKLFLHLKMLFSCLFVLQILGRLISVGSLSTTSAFTR
jgi:hypothetical protein